MKKMTFLLISAGFFAVSGPSFACLNCEVHPVSRQIDFALNLMIDVDACIDAGNILGDFWSTQALVYQDGSGNVATISQVSGSDLSGIVQKGMNNLGHISQFASANYALIYQEGMQNQALIDQNLSFTRGIIIQLGYGNNGAIIQ